MVESFAISLPQQIHDAYNSCSEEEQAVLRQILQELSDTGYSDTYENIWLADYKEIPVGIETFLDSDMFLGKATRHGTGVYPFWRETMIDIFSAGNKYNECIFTGATRIGKTSTAITCAIYLLYRLMCLRDPQEFFGLKDVSVFTFFFFNVTKELASSVAYREFNDTIRSSPWFNAHGTFSRSEQNFYYIPEGGKIKISVGSDASHGLGAQAFCCILDECNFSRAGIKDVSKAKQRMLDTYNTLSARIKGTFRKGGEVYGKMFTVSSKKSDSDFIEEHVKSQLASGAGDHMYVVDKPQWEILPKSRFHDETFYIAVGDRHMKGFVVPDNQTDDASLADLKAQGYTLLTPPIDMKPEFKADFDIALRDLAGISVPGALSFITQEVFSACINKSRRNPFFNDILQIGTKDSLAIEDFFHLEVVPASLRNAEIYIHLDLSLNTDRSGISGGGITSRKDITTSDGKLVSLPYFTHMFSVALEAPRGDKIPYDKILSFIVWLRKQHFNVKVVSRDQFQSEYIGQLLEAQGFESPKISLDRTPDGYIAFRSVLIEQRIDLLDSELLQDELIYLQRDSITGKVDHIVGKSKDLADSVAGWVWECMQRNSGISIPIKTTADAVSAISKVNSSRYSAKSQQPSTLASAFQQLYKGNLPHR